MTYDNGLFEKYVIKFGWTPSFEDADSVNILVISKEQNIHRFHIRCSLFEKNPKVPELLHHITDTINNCINISHLNYALIIESTRPQEVNMFK